MAKHSAGWAPLQKRWLLALLIMLSVSTLIALFIKSAFDSCDHHYEVAKSENVVRANIVSPVKAAAPPPPSPLSFMKSKLVLLVSHELSLSGTVESDCQFVFLSLTTKLEHET